MSIPANSSAEMAAAPCSGPLQEVAQQCAEAERLAAAARVVVEDLQLARRERADLAREYESHAWMGDRHALSEAKTRSQQAYRSEYEHARDGGQVMLATAAWLNELSRFNRGAMRAARDSDGFAQRQTDIGGLVDRLELVADACRIAAASARQACLDARLSLAACQEAREGRLQPAPAATGADAVPVANAAQESSEPALVALLRGDRRMLPTVVGRLADETGQNAGRLQLLLLDLRDAIIASAYDACLLDFPARHPFWSQFSSAEARAIAAALATLGRRFDGQAGWDNGQVATPREMAMAMSLAGRDPRSVRRHPMPAELETLWHGTSIGATEFVLSHAPDLRLEAMIGLLGPAADALAELWDNWGRLRPLLLGSDVALA